MVGFYAYGAASLALTVTNYTNLTNATNRVNRRKTLEFCCGQIDPTQAVKATGFNHRGHGEHRVFKSSLRVPLCPLWLYFLPMLVRSVALLCIQLTITKTLGFLDIARIMQNPRSQNPYMPPPRRVNRTWVGGDMQFLTDWNPDYYTYTEP